MSGGDAVSWPKRSLTAAGRWMALVLIAGCFVVSLSAVEAQEKTGGLERNFPQSKATIEKAVKQMQASTSGKLPVLDGFATAGDHPLDRYQKGFFQAQFQVVEAAGGGTVVRVNVKVTAYYVDPAGAKSGYQLLPSNGRLEEDLLDQLGQQLGGGRESAGNTGEVSNSASGDATNSPAPAPARTTRGPAAKSANQTNLPATVPRLPEIRSGLSASMPRSLADQEKDKAQGGTRKQIEDTTDGPLQAELKSLQEITKNQAYPKNLVAVKKSGTPVVSSASLTARTLFMASEHDEFELLDFNRDWVHVKISGLSRGWIWRNNLEMPDNIPDTDEPPRKDLSPPAATLFHVLREEVAPFPGDWEPLRGKNVKIVSVEPTEDNPKDLNPKVRLEFAKALLNKDYSEISKKGQELAGIVLIFDSADGGMIAATLPILQQWKAGGITDAGLWHHSFFDPPETFNAAAAPAGPAKGAPQAQ